MNKNYVQCLHASLYRRCCKCSAVFSDQEMGAFLSLVDLYSSCSVYCTWYISLDFVEGMDDWRAFRRSLFFSGQKMWNYPGQDSMLFEQAWIGAWKMKRFGDEKLSSLALVGRTWSCETWFLQRGLGISEARRLGLTKSKTESSLCGLRCSRHTRDELTRSSWFVYWCLRLGRKRSS
jgi:hypothetical protein